MLKYSSQLIKQKLKQNDINSLNRLRKEKQQKTKQTLKFMQDWSADLLARELQITKLHQKLQQKLNSHKGNPPPDTQKSKSLPVFDIKKMIEEGMIRKIQQVYFEQLQYQKKYSSGSYGQASRQISQQDQAQSISQLQNHTFCQNTFQNSSFCPEKPQSPSLHNPNSKHHSERISKSSLNSSRNSQHFQNSQNFTNYFDKFQLATDKKIGYENDIFDFDSNNLNSERVKQFNRKNSLMRMGGQNNFEKEVLVGSSQVNRLLLEQQYQEDSMECQEVNRNFDSMQHEQCRERNEKKPFQKGLQFQLNY